MRCGLLGEKLGHSISPWLHEEIWKILGIEGEYEAIEIPKELFEEKWSNLPKKGYRGVNVTIPYKETVIPYLQGITEEARQIKAVNTICWKDSEAFGYNTDVGGVFAMFERARVPLLGKEVILLGGGGASRAVLFALKQSGVKKVVVQVRHEKKAKAELQKDFPWIEVQPLEKSVPGDVLINATPVGMYPHVESTLIDKERLSHFQVVADLIYNPLWSRLLQEGKEVGCQVVSGLDMLVGQAILAEEIWLGQSLEKEIKETLFNKTWEYMKEQPYEKK